MAILTAPLIAQDITNSVTPTPENTAAVSPSPTTILTPTSAATTFIVTATEILIPSIAAIIETPIPSIAATTETPIPSIVAATETPMPPALLLQTVSGYVYYQNSADNQHGNIAIEIFTDARAMISQSVSDANGAYSISVPAEVPFWLVVDAPQHRENAVRVVPGAGLPVLVLLGGDLDDDECVTIADLQMFGQHNPAADVNHDGQITIADGAILTGNLQLSCEIFARTTPTPALENTASATPTLMLTEVAPLPVTLVPPTTVLTEIPLVTPTLTPVLIASETATAFMPTFTPMLVASETATAFVPTVTPIPSSSPVAEMTVDMHGG